MSLDFPAAGDALWALYDAGGPRPEYVLPMLYAESGFDPSVQNAAGSENFGVNQASTSLIGAYAGTDPATYVTWTASEQIRTVVAGMILELVRSYGPLRSGVRVEQANFLPATLPTVRSLSGVLTQAGDAAYIANQALDFGHKGQITLGDLATFLGRHVNAPAVQNAIRSTYELRPTERPRDPIAGEDFGASSPAGTLTMVAGIALLVYAALRSAT